MKSIPALLAAVLLCAAATAPAAPIVISEFGTGNLTETYSDFTTSQNATTLTLSGHDFGMAFYGDIAAAPVDISSAPVQLQLLASFNGTASSAFQIELFDADGDSRAFTFSFSGFVLQNVLTTLTSSGYADLGTFNPLTVTSLGVITAGSPPGASANLTMDRVQAIPEPGSALFLGLGALALSMRRRRSA